MKIAPALRASLFAGVLLTGASSLHAQATRTWVSGVGDDANPCSRTAPCKTFAGAISKTAASGEINVLDPGGFGAVTITKALVIDGSGGSIAGILNSGQNGVVINAGTNDVVILRNLEINGAGNGLNGIRFVAGKALYIENCTITGSVGSTSYGVDFEPAAGAAQLFITNSTIRNCPGGAVLVRPGTGATAQATLEGVVLSKGQFGLRAEDRAKVTANGCAATGNTANGFLAFSGTGAAVEVNLGACVAANNGTNGVSSVNVGATIRVNTVSVTDNGNVGLISTGGGAILSYGNNRVSGNVGGDGAPTGTLTAQ